MKRLQDGEWPAGVRLVSVYSRADRVTPYPAAFLDTMGHPQVRNREVSCSHREFLYKRRVYQAILEEIREGGWESGVVRGSSGPGGRPEAAPVPW